MHFPLDTRPSRLSVPHAHTAFPALTAIIVPVHIVCLLFFSILLVLSFCRAVPSSTFLTSFKASVYFPIVMLSRRRSDAVVSKQLRPNSSSSRLPHPISPSRNLATDTQASSFSANSFAGMTNMKNLHVQQQYTSTLFHSSSHPSLHQAHTSCPIDPVEDTSGSACFSPVAQSLARKLEQVEDTQSSTCLSEPSDDHSDRRYSDFSQGSPINQSLNFHQRPCTHAQCTTASAHLTFSQMDPEQNICTSFPVRSTNDHKNQPDSASSHSHINQPVPLETVEQGSFDSPLQLTRQSPRPNSVEPNPEVNYHVDKSSPKQLPSAPLQGPAHVPPDFCSSTSLPYVRCRTSVIPKTTPHQAPANSLSTTVDFDHVYNSTPHILISPTPRPQPVRPAAQEPAPNRKRMYAFWKFFSSRPRPRRPRRHPNDAIPPHSSPNSPPTSPKRDWMTESFRLLRRTNNFPSERMTPVPSPSGSTTASATASATSSNTPPATYSTSQITLSQASVPTTSSPMRTSSRTRRIKHPSHVLHSVRTRSSNTSCSSATVDVSVAPLSNGSSQKCNTGNSSFSSMPTVLRSRPMTFADAREPKSLGNVRGRFVITTESSSISSCSDREDDTLNNSEAQHLLLSRRQLHAMDIK